MKKTITIEIEHKDGKVFTKTTANGVGPYEMVGVLRTLMAHQITTICQDTQSVSPEEFSQAGEQKDTPDPDKNVTVVDTGNTAIQLGVTPPAQPKERKKAPTPKQLANEMIKTGDIHFADKKYDDAIALYNHAKRIDPENKKADGLILKAQQWKKAMEDLANTPAAAIETGPPTIEQTMPQPEPFQPEAPSDDDFDLPIPQ